MITMSIPLSAADVAASEIYDLLHTLDSPREAACAMAVAKARMLCAMEVDTEERARECLQQFETATLEAWRQMQVSAHA